MDISSDRDTVEKLLKPIEPHIYSIVAAAWRDWQTSTGRTRYKRTRANVVFDRMIDKAFDVLPFLDGIAFKEKYETAHFIKDGQVIFRFKKGDEYGLSRNYPTQLALAFNDPAQMVLGFAEAIKVDIVYVLNHLETEIDRIMIVRRNGDLILWAYDLTSVTAEIIAMPTIQPATEPAQPVRISVRGKGQKHKNNKK